MPRMARPSSSIRLLPTRNASMRRSIRLLDEDRLARREDLSLARGALQICHQRAPALRGLDLLHRDQLPPLLAEPGQDLAPVVLEERCHEVLPCGHLGRLLQPLAGVVD